MAIVFLQNRKRQQGLIIVFGLVALITIFVIWQGFFKKEKVGEGFSSGLILFPRQEVNINYDVLKDPLLEELQPFSEIEAFKENAAGGETLGRTNPFVPYPGY